MNHTNRISVWVLRGAVLGLLATLCTMHLHSDAPVSLRIIDKDTGEQTPVRVRFTNDLGGIVPLPGASAAVMWGRRDEAEGYAFQRDSSFYSCGAIEASLPPGTYHIHLSKGNEYLPVSDVITIQPDEQVTIGL